MKKSQHSYEYKSGTVFRVWEIHLRAEYNESNEKVIIMPKVSAENLKKK